MHAIASVRHAAEIRLIVARNGLVLMVGLEFALTYYVSKLRLKAETKSFIWFEAMTGTSCPLVQRFSTI